MVRWGGASAPPHGLVVVLMSAHREDAAGPVRWVTQVLAWVVIGGFVLLIAVAVVVPRLGGATPYTVLTSSMEPSYPPGTLVVVRPVEPDRLVAGDVITYQLKSGRPTVVTHRVTSVGYDLTGTLRLTTQGDANSAADQDPVIAEQVRGRLWYSIPHVGRVNTWLTPDVRDVATAGVVAGLSLYAAYMFTSAAVDRRRRAPETETKVH